MQKCKKRLLGAGVEPFFERVERLSAVALHAPDHSVIAERLDLVVEKIESAGDSRLAPENESRHRTAGVIAVLLQKFLNGRNRIGQSKADIVVHAAVGR